ncbi:MAG: prolipoprotein diacylglyceryl transferase family protein [Planctomycetota bacterium]
MHPVLFEIPFLHFPLRSFGVLVAAGFLLGIWVWGRLLARYGEDPERDPERGSQVAIWVLVGVLGGARLMYVAVEAGKYLRAEVTPAMESYLAARDRATAALDLQAEHAEEVAAAREIAVGRDFLRDPLRILFLWEGGLVMYGGLFGGVLLGMWAARRRGLDPRNALDTGLVAGFLGQAVGRWGCLLVGDDYGSVVPERFQDLPFPLTIRVPSLEWLEAHPQSLFDHSLAGQVLWATQPWMSLNALLVALVAWLVLRRRRRYGEVGAVVLVQYSIVRFVIEIFRGDTVRGTWLGGVFSTSQLIAIPAALAGIWLLVRFRRRRDPVAGGAGAR